MKLEIELFTFEEAPESLKERVLEHPCKERMMKSWFLTNEENTTFVAIEEPTQEGLVDTFGKIMTSRGF